MRAAVLRGLLCLGLVTVFVRPAPGQEFFPPERPAPAKPIRPRTAADTARREARVLFGLAVMRQKEDRLVEAARLFEDARKLDPTAAPIVRLLIPLYLALSRSDDALAACRRALDLDPNDHATWALYARQLKNAGRSREAQAAWTRALACPNLADHPELHVQYAHDLGSVSEDLRDFDRALAAFAEEARLLDHPQGLSEVDGYDPADVRKQAEAAHERLIKICIDSRQYERALALFAEAQKVHPSLARRLTFSLARIQLALERPEQALAYLDDYLRTQPAGTEGYELKIQLLNRLGRGADVVDALRADAERDPHHLGLRLLLARQCAVAGRPQEAEAVYTRLVERAPTADVYKGLFGLYQAVGDAGYQKILALLDDALRRSGPAAGGDGQAAAQGRGMLAALREEPALGKGLVSAAARGARAPKPPRELAFDTRLVLAVLAGRHEQYAEAELFYRSCLGDRSNPRTEPSVYAGLLQALWQQDKPEAIVEICRRGLRETPAANHVVLHDSLSRALAYLGKMEEGITHARRAVEAANADNALRTRLNLVRVLTYAGRYPEALTEVRALEKDFHHPGEVQEIRLALYNVYSAQHEDAKSEELLGLILKDDPNNATANNDLGYLWADQGKNLDEAERLIRKALALDREARSGDVPGLGTVHDEKDNAAFLDSLGWVLFRRGKLSEARQQLEQAAKLPQGAGDPAVWDHLAEVYRAQGDRDRAVGAWRKAVLLYETGPRRQADKHYQEMKQKLQRIESETRRP